MVKDLGVSVHSYLLKTTWRQRYLKQTKWLGWYVETLRSSTLTYLDGPLLHFFDPISNMRILSCHRTWKSISTTSSECNTVQPNELMVSKNLEYQERLLRLNLLTLAIRGDMVEVFKHLHCYDKSTLNDRFVLVSVKTEFTSWPWTSSEVSQRWTMWDRT